MKRHIILLLTALTLAFAACSTDGDSLIAPDKLEVGVTPGWVVTRGLSSSSQTVNVAVKLNVQTIHWTVSSDSEWCVVDEEANHVGDGEFAVAVTGNDDFDTRNAIVTIQAGSFSHKIQVDQSGNIFILDRTYSAVASGDTESFDIKVRTQKAWEPVDSEWIHGEVIETSEPNENGMIESTLRIHCDANTAQTGRYGTLAIEPTDGVSYGTVYTIYQFGTDISSNEDNTLSLPAHTGEAFNIVVPADAVVGVVCPDWVTYQDEPGEEGTTNYLFSVVDNPSDTKSSREGVVELSIRDVAANTVLPTLKQAFYPAGGIISGKGMKMFAEALNAGESIADWVEEGSDNNVLIMGDIDMTDIEWVAAGTDAHPFTGTISGNNFKILNWTSSQPLFGYLAEGSEVRDLTVDASSKITAKSTAANVYTAAIAGICDGTILNCHNQAMVSLDVTATVNGSTGVAGVVGMVGATGRVEKCTNKGLISLGDKVNAAKLSIGGVVAETAEGAVIKECINESSIASSGATPAKATAGLYTGGVVGYAGGAVENCATQGGKSIAVKIKAAYMSYTGGIAGWANADVTGATNRQPISITANRLGDACRYAYMGGISGKNVGSISQSNNQGELTAVANCKFVIMGGIVGAIDGAVTGCRNTARVYAPGNPGGTAGPLAESYVGPRYAYLGGIAGQVTAQGSITGIASTTTNSGAVTIDEVENNAEVLVHVGGIVGQLYGSVSATSNTADVSISADSKVSVVWKVRSIGGIAGIMGDVAKVYEGVSVAGSTNTGLVKHARNAKTTATPIYQGGIVGYIVSEGSSVSNCTNSGEVNDDTYNNNIEYYELNGTTVRRANCTGGVVGAMVSTAAVNTVSACNSLGLTTSYRGMLGGVVGYADNARIAECNSLGNTGAEEGRYSRNSRAGGIVAHAVNTQIENCINKSTVLTDYAGDGSLDGQTIAGGIVGVLGANSSVKSCKHRGVVITVEYGNGTYKTLSMGGVAGKSVAGTEISNCGFGGQLKGKTAEYTYEMTLNHVCSDKNFTAVTPNYLWDGK